MYFKYLNFFFLCSQYSKLGIVEHDKVVSEGFSFPLVPSFIFLRFRTPLTLIALYIPTHMPNL